MTASALATTPVVQGSNAQTETGGTTADNSEVVKTSSVPVDRRKAVRVKFRPWAQPSPAKVRKIIRIEAKRYGINPSGLMRRVQCESNFRWNANGGSYFGLLQFSPSTFQRGVSSLTSRRVKIVKRSSRKVWETRIVTMASGERREENVRKVRQRIKRVYVGKLPRRPSLMHGWTQIRIGAAAIAGKSGVNSSEWGCSA